jgi:hypothetical protein
VRRSVASGIVDVVSSELNTKETNILVLKVGSEDTNSVRDTSSIGDNVARELLPELLTPHG